MLAVVSQSRGQIQNIDGSITIKISLDIIIAIPFADKSDVRLINPLIPRYFTPHKEYALNL